MSLIIRLAWSIAGVAASALVGVVILSAEEHVVVWEDGCPRRPSGVAEGTRYVVTFEGLSVGVDVETYDAGVVAVDLVVANGAADGVRVIPGRVQASVPRGRSGRLDRFNAGGSLEPALGVVIVRPGDRYTATAWFKGLDRQDRRLLVRVPVEDLVVEFPVSL